MSTIVRMFARFATVLTIFNIISVQGISNSSIEMLSIGRNQSTEKNDTDLLGELMLRMEEMYKNINLRLDRIDMHLSGLEHNDRDIMRKQMVGCDQKSTDSRISDNKTSQPANPNTSTSGRNIPLPTNCDEAMGKRGKNGTYTIKVPNSGMDPFDVYCMNKISNEPINGTWMIFQRRQYNDTEFYRGWADYKLGFGSLDKDFWIGLDKLHALTNFTEQELWIQLEDDNIWALYSQFAVGTESEFYTLNTLGSCIGPAGDALRYHRGGKFSTKDRNNDKRDCLNERKGAWWYKNCGNSNLNGMYGVNDPLGIVWHTWKPYHSNKYAHMAIRPRRNK